MMASGCERDFDELDQANNPNTPEIFIDGFSGGLNYAAFGGSDVKAFNVDTEVKYKGTASIRIAVPDKNAPTGAYAGGVYYTNSGRDLSSYNVLTFWAKASKSASIDIIGFGNDLGENKYQAAITGVAMNTNWKKYYIPIPDPSKLTNEKGMFFYSEGPEDDKGYTFWIDEVKFEALGTVTKAIGSIMEGKDDVVSAETGATFTVNGFTTANTPQGVDQKVQTSTAYFEFSTSNPSVASVTNTGSVKVMDAGKAVINAKLGGNVAKGSLTINSTGAPILPMTIAPKPTKAANKVISIFSNEYTNVPVDYFNGYWQFSTAQIADIKVNGDDIKRYSQLNFVGIQFTMPTIDAKDMTNFHIDIWTPDNITATSSFKILLVDIGADKSFEGNDNSSHEITIPITSLKKDSWISLDIPFSSMTGLKSKNNLAQIVLSGNLPNVFVDNIYFSNDALTEPATAAPTPTKAAVNVKSVFSDTYSNIPGTDFNPNWGQSTLVTQQSIQGNNTLKYTNLNYQGTQFASAQDVSAMEFMHIDYWSANSTTLNVFLISEGPKEKASVLNVPTSGWRSVDIPLSAFDGVDLKKIIQLKIEGNGTVFFDNIYFYKAATASLVPTSAAPTPSLPQASVISLFSDTYTNVPVDNWRTDWSAATLEDLTIQGNKVKKYSKLDFVGIETVSKTVNASGMTHLHIDIWSPDFENFAIKLVDLGANGTFGGGDDVEHQVDFAKPEKSNWVSLDIPLVNFTGLTTKNNIAQYILVGRPTAATTVYVDNLYFHK
jgi:hypothetical protein